MTRSIYFSVLLLSAAYTSLRAAQPIPVMALRANTASQQVTVSWAKTSLSASNQTPLFFDFQLQASGDLKSANAWSNSGPFIPGGLGGASTTLSQTVTASAAGFFRLFHGLNLPGENMAGLDFSEVDFTRGNLAGANLTGADLQNTSFDEADLSNADLSGANLTGADFTSANLDGTIFDSIGGPSGGPAGGSIPILPYDTDISHFDTNTMTSTNILLVFPQPWATVAEVNGLIVSNNGQIVGGFPGSTNITDTSMLIIRFPSLGPGGLPQMETVFTSNPAINDAFADRLLFEEALPDLDVAHPQWQDWTTDSFLGNWGIRNCRFPQLWNFNEFIHKRINQQGEQNRVSRVGVIDTGYYLQHPDIVDQFDLVRRAGEGDHGTHVSGIIAAGHNGFGTDGASPFATLYVTGADTGSTIAAGNDLGDGTLSIGQLYCDFVVLLELAANVQVVNISMGTPFRKLGLDPTTNLVEQRKSSREGRQFNAIANRPNAPFVIKSAGNDGYPAKWNTGIAYASLALNNPNILIIEALAGTAFEGNEYLVTQWTTNSTYGSNFEASLSAPGFNILSTVGNSGYAYKNGTSMAAPLVTGLAAYLFSLQPDLTRAELENLLDSSSVEVSGAAYKIDAWYAAMFIDSIRPNTPMLRALLDIDDGTEDGNQRETMLAKFDEQDDPTTFDTEPFSDSDLNLIGDGSIDMSDFRRFRDWNLIVAAENGDTAADDGLDGPANHPKNDPNRNGVPASLDNYDGAYPRTDFNGDSLVHDPAYIAYMPVPFDAEVSDLEVFQHLFTDPRGDYQSADLPDLLQSSELHISLYWMMDFNTDEEIPADEKIDKVTISIDSRQPRIMRSFTFDLPEGEPDRKAHFLITLTTFNQHRVSVCAEDANGNQVGGESELFFFNSTPGKDYWFAPRVLTDATCGPGE